MLSMSKSQYGIRNIEVTYVPVNSVGSVYFSDVISVIHPGQIVLVTLILAKNKSGAFHPVDKVAAHFR